MKKLLTLLSIAAMSIACNNTKETVEPLQLDTQMTSEEISAGVLTPRVMWRMGRLGEAKLSPDGKTVAYTVTYYNVDQNRGAASLYVMNADGSNATQLTDFAGSESDVQWSADGEKIYFLSTRSGSAQIWSIAPNGTALTQLSNIEGGINGFGIAQDGKNVWYAQTVHVAPRKSKDVYAYLPESKALIYDDLMARHWDYWDQGDYSHIFVTELKGNTIAAGKDIMAGEAWDAPMAPYFDNAEISWSNSGKLLAYTCKKMAGSEYAFSTDSDIYVYDVESGKTTNVTKGMLGYDKYPVFSPNDSKIAFTSMERPGNEADKDRLMVVNLANGEKTYVTRDFDYNAANIRWNDENTLTFISPIAATHQICTATLDGQIKVLTNGDHDYTWFDRKGEMMVAGRNTISQAAELYSVNTQSGESVQLSFINKQIYDNVKMGEVQKRWVKTTDGKQMLVWVILPPNFDATKKYPTLLYCEGGPQSVVSNGWSYRWNFQLMAAQGYIVVAPNRRGLPSFGQEWLDQISGDYSGQNIRDYLAAIDDVAKEPWADEDRMGCVGASYGGYSTFYLAGHHEKRFKAFIAHCGMFNFESFYTQTEELWFPTRDLGGAPWSDDPTAKRSYANSPHKAAKNWDTPILIITGMKDFRIPYTQSLEAFSTARAQGIPSKLVAFENEAHQVFKPQNNLVWNSEFFGWLDKYLK